MASRIINPPPTYEKLVDENGNITVAWSLFFEQLFNGDQGNSWTPVATSLGQTGTPTLSGTLYRISQKLYYFDLLITPATNTSSVAGTTYFTGLPLTGISNGFCTAQSSNLGDPTGMYVAASGRIYTPAWTNITVPVTVSGVIKAQ